MDKQLSIAVLVATVLLAEAQGQAEETFQCGSYSCLVATQACYGSEEDKQCVSCAEICSDKLHKDFCRIHCKPYLQSLSTPATNVGTAVIGKSQNGEKQDATMEPSYIGLIVAAVALTLSSIIAVGCYSQKKSQQGNNVTNTNGGTAAANVPNGVPNTHPRPESTPLVGVTVENGTSNHPNDANASQNEPTANSSTGEDGDIRPIPLPQRDYKEAQELESMQRMQQFNPPTERTDGGQPLTRPVQEPQIPIDPDRSGGGTVSGAVPPAQPSGSTDRDHRIEGWARDNPPPDQQASLKQHDVLEQERGFLLGRASMDDGGASMTASAGSTEAEGN